MVQAGGGVRKQMQLSNAGCAPHEAEKKSGEPAVPLLLGYHYDDSTVTRTTASPLYYSILLDGAQSAKSESLSQTERVDKDRIVPM